MAVEGTLVRETIVEGIQAYRLFTSELLLSPEGTSARQFDRSWEHEQMHAITRLGVMGNVTRWVTT